MTVTKETQKAHAIGILGMLTYSNELASILALTVHLTDPRASSWVFC